jgi:hypothetical protein
VSLVDSILLVNIFLKRESFNTELTLSIILYNAPLAAFSTYDAKKERNDKRLLA